MGLYLLCPDPNPNCQVTRQWEKEQRSGRASGSVCRVRSLRLSSPARKGVNTLKEVFIFVLLITALSQLPPPTPFQGHSYISNPL